MALMNVKVILQVVYMSAFRPSFCLNGSFARVFKIFSHRQTHTHTHGTNHSTPAQARGNYVFVATFKTRVYAHVYTCTCSKHVLNYNEAKKERRQRYSSRTGKSTGWNSNSTSTQVWALPTKPQGSFATV